MKSVLGIIIAFDNDNDLREITDHRTMGAVQWGGRYRIVDFMLSNMVNSGIYRVGILMHGIQVQPLDWLDPKWIKNTITDRLDAAGAER